MRSAHFNRFALVLCALFSPLISAQINQFIDDTVVQQISLTVKPADWEAMLQDYESDTYYKATFVWNGVTETIGIRQHGGGSRSPIKPNIDLNFAKYTSTQTLLGDSFLVLKANNEDPSNLHEWISMKLYRRMGFPAPRESFATVTVNGMYLGFYMIVEHDDIAFPLRNYGENGGYFYEWQNIGDNYDFGNLGTNPSSYSGYLELKSNQTSADLQTFTNMVQVINTPASSSFTNAQFIAALQPYMDPQMFLTYAATENVLAEADGMVGGIEGINNINLYQFAGTTLYYINPWDKDLTFSDPARDIYQGFTSGNINVLAARLYTIPGYTNFYMDQLSRAANLLGGTGGWADSEVAREYGVINAYASNDPNKQCITAGLLISCGETDYQNAVTNMHEFLATRSSFVLNEIAAQGYQMPATDPSITSVGSAGLTGATGMSPGAVVLVNGALFGTMSASSQAPLPRVLGNNFVAVEGERAAMSFTTSGQIQIQAPWDVPLGNASVVVSVNGLWSNSFLTTMQATTPVILGVYHADGTAITSSSPGNPGETITISMTGLGDVSSETVLGAASPSSPLSTTLIAPTVSLGGVALSVSNSSLTPGLVGVYEVNAVLPLPLGQSGSPALTVSSNGLTATVALPLE
jgi:uncharacterized protein (TIGR03437 family)